MSRETASRYRITFAKTEHMRYTSHLDLQRTWERLMRRAELPLLFSGGFHPRIRFNLAAALPLGFTGEAEICDLYLTEPLGECVLLERLRDSAPPGVRVDRVREVPSLGPAVQTLIRSAEYEIAIPAEDVEGLASRVETLVATGSIPRERRGKPYDLRPLVEEITLATHEGGVRLRARLACRPGATGRPDELLQALDVDPLAARVCRTRLLVDEPAGDASAGVAPLGECASGEPERDPVPVT